MKEIVYLFLVLSSVYATENLDNFINEINNKQNLWTAGRNFNHNAQRSDFRLLLGRRSVPKDIIKSIPVVNHDIRKFNEIPESFDARTHWPQCKSIKYVPDQSSCGSCWAVSVASAISDRICIHSNGKLQPFMSAINLVACEISSHGCDGGHEVMSWRHYESYGLVTGGSYSSNIGCLPYPFPPCEHFVEGPRPTCRQENYPTPYCIKSCNNSKINYEQDLFYGNSTYFLASNETQIQMEILKNGPVVTVLQIFTDWLYYKKGVYIKTSGILEGEHAVRIIGWGVEKGTKYWLIVNSWNTDWGEDGLFKIRRGTNEAGIEAEVSAGIPR